MNDKETIESLQEEIKRLKEWVSDCQSGMYINCVYCGHRYGPRESTPVAMADVLKKHIEQCPKHPLSKAIEEIKRLQNNIQRLETIIEQKNLIFKTERYLE